MLSSEKVRTKQINDEIKSSFVGIFIGTLITGMIYSIGQYYQTPFSAAVLWAIYIATSWIFTELHKLNNHPRWMADLAIKQYQILEQMEKLTNDKVGEKEVK